MYASTSPIASNRSIGGRRRGDNDLLSSKLKGKNKKKIEKIIHLKNFYHVLKRSKGDELCALIRSLDDTAIDQICELFYNIMVSQSERTR